MSTLPEKEENEKNKVNEKKYDRYNEPFIQVLGEIKDIMARQGDPFRAKAYQKAQETVMVFPDDIVDPKKQLSSKPGIGPAILGKLEEFVKTGKILFLEKERNNPINIFLEIHGIGPKRALDLVKNGITTIEQLKNHVDKLNDIQKIGLKYYDDIRQRIPRSEIDEFYIQMGLIFEEYIAMGVNFDIVGSYRRGLANSGDIDIIITSTDGKPEILNVILKWLKDDGTIVEFLSHGKIKSMVIAKINQADPNSPARRIDFLYSPPSEYAFAVLYFTGSKIFNTIVRQRALDLGYTLNEHGLCHMVNGVKGAKVDHEFPDEKSILNFLGIEYVDPEKRIDGKSMSLFKSGIALNTPTASGIALNTPTASGIALNTPTASGIALNTPTASGIAEKKIEKIVTGSQSQHNTTLKKSKMEPDIDSVIESYVHKLKTEGISALKMMTEKELTVFISAANKAYHYDNEDDNEDDRDPIMSDNLYDILREYILDKYPDNDVAKSGHASIINDFKVEKNKVKLPYELWSMDKRKADSNNLLKWANKYNGPYVVSCKLDGLSALYVSGEKAEEAMMYTRGNGKYGQNISHLIPYIIRGNPLNPLKSFVPNVAIRGEIVIKKKVFEEKYANKYSSARDFAKGIVNSKTINPNTLKDIDFVPYEVIKPALKPSEQMKFLKDEWICDGVQYTTLSNIYNEILSANLLDWRDDYIYEIDGLVVVDDKVYARPQKNPDYAFAFKMVISDQFAEAKVVDVIWTPSKDGYLKPRIRIEPVVLSGATIEYATGKNAQFIKENMIGVGAIVKIVRSGEVIPDIKNGDVIVPAEVAMMPLVPYTWNETGVDIILDNKDGDDTVKAKNITGFFKGIEVDGLGAGNIKRIIAAGYDTVPKIIAMTYKDFLKVEGFKDKLATKIQNSIKEKVNNASIVALMTASNIFGRGFGERRFTAILDAYPDILIDGEDDKHKLQRIVSVEGMAGKTAQRFVEKIGVFLEFMNDAGLEGTLYNVEKHPNPVVELVGGVGGLGGLPLSGKRIVMTGFRDKVLGQKIKDLGGDLADSVTKNTFVVLVKDKDEDTGKAGLAWNLNIPLMTPDEFSNKYFG